MALLGSFSVYMELYASRFKAGVPKVRPHAARWKNSCAPRLGT